MIYTPSITNRKMKFRMAGTSMQLQIFYSIIKLTNQYSTTSVVYS